MTGYILYSATLISHLLIVEHVHGQFLIERKLLDTYPATVGILGKKISLNVIEFVSRNPTVAGRVERSFP